MQAKAARILPAPGTDADTALSATLAVLAFGLLATIKWGFAGLILPLLVVGLLVLITRPVAAVTLVVGLVILCERATFGLFTFTYSFYDSVVKDVTIPDALTAFAVASVGLDLIRRRQTPWVPRPLRLPLTLLVLAMLAGAITGHAAGASIHAAIFSEDTLADLLFLSLAVANLDLDRAQLKRLLMWALALSVLKALLGLLELASGKGLAPEGIGLLTYYEVGANWVVMTGLFAAVASVVMGVRRSPTLLLAGLALFLCLLLSYRRSFWIAAVLGVTLILLLGLAPAGRRLLLPAAVAFAIAVWALSSVSIHAQHSPIVTRALSLQTSSLETSVDDRYRIDERANVWGAIEEHPITGLGVTIPWRATIEPLPIDTEGGREYVHFALLWWWLKLGVLGALAYVALLLGSGVMAWQAWRLQADPMLRVFGLASLCAIVGLAVLDTTASFTGVDPRFSIIFAGQLGLLALATRAPLPAGAEDGAQAPRASASGPSLRSRARISLGETTRRPSTAQT